MSATPCPKCGLAKPVFRGYVDPDWKTNRDPSTGVELICDECGYTSGPVSNYAAAVAKFYDTTKEELRP